MADQGRDARGVKAPANVLSLRKRLSNHADGDAKLAHELARSVALVVLGQILRECPRPEADVGFVSPAVAAVKGGTAMRIRLGYAGSRFSSDFDIAKARGVQDFEQRFDLALRNGWAGFTGELRASRNVSNPLGVPAEYVMRAFDVKLRYAGPGRAFAQDFLTVTLEAGHDELDDTLETIELLDPDVSKLFTLLGLPDPAPVPVIADHHQIAQKLHAMSAPNSPRAHDLVDLQLLERHRTESLDRVARTCERLFALRRAHDWPPRINVGVDWELIYANAAQGLDVLQDVHAAAEWGNAYVAKLVDSRSQK